jgi:hypothetical protein
MRLRCILAVSLCHLATTNPIFAQAGRQPTYEEAIRSAQQAEMLGYILAGAGLLLVVAAIPLGIYLDRKKKARRLAERDRD